MPAIRRRLIALALGVTVTFAACAGGDRGGSAAGPSSLTASPDPATPTTAPSPAPTDAASTITTTSSTTTTTRLAGPGGAPAAARLRVEVVERRPHDPTAFTQGLVLDGTTLYESTGQYGQSTVREVDARTGEVRRQRAIGNALFGEGLALVGDELVQLTWREGVALVHRRDDLVELRRIRYDGEGWGLCDDGERLVMSDGTATLHFRDRRSFALTGSVTVRRDGVPVTQLNELECVGGMVWANVWQTDTIVRIDPASGTITGTVDASALLSAGERRSTDVLNGIAFDPARGTFLITGKWWPALFEVRFVPA